VQALIGRQTKEAVELAARGCREAIGKALGTKTAVESTLAQSAAIEIAT
jgi:hypothetical protein